MEQHQQLQQRQLDAMRDTNVTAVAATMNTGLVDESDASADQLTMNAHVTHADDVDVHTTKETNRIDDMNNDALSFHAHDEEDDQNFFHTVAMDVTDSVLLDPDYAAASISNMNKNPKVTDSRLQAMDLAYIDHDLPPPPVSTEDRMQHYKNKNVTSWDNFYRHNGNRSYMNRHWLFQEFPELQQVMDVYKEETTLLGASSKYDFSNIMVPLEYKATKSECAQEWLSLSSLQGGDRSRNLPIFMEIGCGVGDTLIPIMKEMPSIRAIGCDCSNVALKILSKNDEFESKRAGFEIIEVQDPHRYLLDQFAYGMIQVALNHEPENATSRKGKRKRGKGQPKQPNKAKHINTIEKKLRSEDAGSNGSNTEIMIEIPDSPIDVAIADDVSQLSSQNIGNNSASDITLPAIESRFQVFKNSALLFDHNLEADEFPEALHNTVDFASLIFVLSTTTPGNYGAILSDVRKLIRPGGHLFIRDYARYDMAQMRFGMESQIGPNLYVRGEGTRAYFFTLEELKKLVVEAGFELISAVLCLKRVRNRKLMLEMNRRFVQIRARVPNS